MGTVFEELIRKFNEEPNENAGEYFTPRDVVHLMVDLLRAGDRMRLRTKGVVRSVYDPHCGSGGMLTIRSRLLPPRCGGDGLSSIGSTESLTMSIYPFQDGDTVATFRNITERTVAKIEALENDYVLKASPTELEHYYVSEVVVRPLVLDASNHYIEKQEGTQIDVSHDFRRAAFGGEGIVVKGTALHIAIPFDGDAALWRIRPSTYSLSGYPELEIRDAVVVFECSFPDDTPDPSGLKAEIERTIRSLSDTVSNLARDVEKHNEEAPRAVRAALERKLSRAKAAVGAVEALGIPVKQRSAPETFVVPTKRREPPVSRPAVREEKFVREPTLDQREFEHVLGILRSMALVIERSPASFASLDEEGIRTHFLLQLNGHYEGAATGETFNASGKTDILIRADDRNVFIAECKFWRGTKSFSEAIDQLLGYLSWRDSKCALLIFNRTRDSTAVGQKMHETMEGRAEYRKTSGDSSNGDARYVFVKPSDPGREIHIQTMLFDIPAFAE